MLILGLVSLSGFINKQYIFESDDDYWVTSTDCMIACRFNEGHACILFIDAQIQGIILS